MGISDKRRLFIAWIVLVGITLVYLWIDRTPDATGALVASTTITVAAIALALVKFRIILREFMGVRNAPVILQRLTDVLVVAIGVALLSTYLIGHAVA